MALVDNLTLQLDRDMTTHSKLELWETVCEQMNNLLDMIKSVQIQRNFTLFLKYSHAILKLFLSHGVSVVESCLKSRTERVYTLLKGLQLTTRFLHSLCCQSKKVKNGAIVAQIPGLRQTVEQLNYCVKGALVANKCSTVFWLGNLKNKDLQGDEILSQITNTTHGEEEELPSDDDTVEGSYLGMSTMNRPSCSTIQSAVAGTSSRR